MSETTLTIVPVKLHPPQDSSTFQTNTSFSIPICLFKLTNMEITLFNGINERIVQSIIKELKCT